MFFRGLNEIRGICVLLVLITHIFLYLPHFGINIDMNSLVIRNLNFSFHAVTIFFVLSGFLITFLLIKDERHDIRELKSFYMRRILRIWPLYFAYSLIVMTLIIDPFSNKELTSSYLFFYSNVYFSQGIYIDELAHLWSLAVEEQFYLFWPLLFLFAIKNKMSLTRLLIGFILGFELLKFITYGMNGWNFLVKFMATTRFDSMALGCLLAVLFVNKDPLIERLNKKSIQIFSWLMLVFLSTIHTPAIITSQWVSLFSFIIIAGQIQSNRSLPLNNRTLDFLGRISFGLYVIHPVILYLFQKNIQFPDSLIGILAIFGLISSASILMAFLSFKYFESPFLKWKVQKFTPKASS